MNIARIWIKMGSSKWKTKSFTDHAKTCEKKRVGENEMKRRERGKKEERSKGRRTKRRKKTR